MPTFLKIVSGLYLLIVWLVFFSATRIPAPPTLGSDFPFRAMVLVLAVSFSIPAAILYAFGQLVAEVRSIRHLSHLQAEHLKAVRRYYEPQGR